LPVTGRFSEPGWEGTGGWAGPECGSVAPSAPCVPAMDVGVAGAVGCAVWVVASAGTWVKAGSGVFATGASLPGVDVGLMAGSASVGVAGAEVVADGSGSWVDWGGCEAVGTTGGTAVAVSAGTMVGETLFVGTGLGFDMVVGVSVGVLVGVLVRVLVLVLVG
jgi:hypothetical protein